MSEEFVNHVLTEEDCGENDNVTVLEADTPGARCDVYVAERLGLTRSAVQKLLTGGMITVCGTPAAKNYKLRAGDRIEVTLPEPEAYEVAAEDIPLDVVWEDEHIIVINKPQGMVVHPAPGHTSGTLVNGLMHHCGSSLSGINGVLRPGIVHRIDRDTSGLICVAKNDDAHVGLSAQLKDHTMHREYRAIVTGGFDHEGG
ncbi:MAG: RluA family pseudouridine synthase, partial [Ruminococcaceae bacterium]|nr:RluA family pseudouridine synthase [Oscillospiraceae bacterium]